MLAGVLYKKKKEELIVLNIFYFFKKKIIIFRYCLVALIFFSVFLCADECDQVDKKALFYKQR